MFATDEIIAAVHEAYAWGGTWLAVAELRKRFKDIDNDTARDAVERILTWQKVAVPSDRCTPSGRTRSAGYS